MTTTLNGVDMDMTSVPDLPPGSGHIHACLVEFDPTTLVIMGGMSEKEEVLNKAYKLDLEGGTRKA